MAKTRNANLDLKAIGQRMRLIRAKLRKTQANMSRDLGISLSHYSKLEVGIGGMSHGLVYTFCKLYDVPQDWFCFGTGDEPAPTDPQDTGNKEKRNAEYKDEMLERIITFVLEEETLKLAAQIAEATHTTKVHALAILVGEKLKANEDKKNQ